MKKNDKADLRSKSPKDLQKILQETRVTLAKVKLELQLGKHTNVHAAKDLRKKTAVIQTLLREQTLGVKS